MTFHTHHTPDTGESTLFTPDKPQLSAMAKRLKNAASRHALVIAHAPAIDLIAAALGFRSDNALIAAARAKGGTSKRGAEETGSLKPYTVVLLDNANDSLCTIQVAAPDVENARGIATAVYQTERLEKAADFTARLKGRAFDRDDEDSWNETFLQQLGFAAVFEGHLVDAHDELEREDHILYNGPPLARPATAVTREADRKRIEADFLLSLLGNEAGDIFNGLEMALNEGFHSTDQQAKKGVNDPKVIEEKRLKLEVVESFVARLRRLWQAEINPNQGRGIKNPELANTRVSYMYRDGDNYKTSVAFVLAGRLTETEVTEIHGLFDRSYDGFIPGQVGLPDLQDSYDGCTSYWHPERDGPWHEDLEFEPTSAKPDHEISCHELLQAFRQVSWDENYRPNFYGEMSQRFIATRIEESITESEEPEDQAVKLELLEAMISAAKEKGCLDLRWYRKEQSIFADGARQVLIFVVEEAGDLSSVDQVIASQNRIWDTYLE